MSKWKKTVRIILVAALGILFVFPIFADDIYEARQKQSELESELAESEEKLANLKNKVDKAQQAVDEIDGQIAEVESVISGYEADKQELEEQIRSLQKQINRKQKEIDHEYGMMSKRIKFLYENLGNSYAEALLTSDTFADALNKVQYLLELSDYDRRQMEHLEKLQKAIQEDQDEVEDQKKEVNELLDAQEDQKEVLDGMLEVKAAALEKAEEAQATEEEKNAYIAGLLEEQKETVNALVEEYNRKLQEQLEAQRKAAAENGEDAPINPGDGGKIWSGGDFLWPLPSPYDTSYITSWFGYRTDPFGGGYTTYHSGIDIGAPCNTEIYAVLPGTVVISADGWNGGCGNYTVIYHGGNLYTEYMHQNVRAVSVGDTVEQGQVIGYVGTTGSSTGYHLHIGVVESDHGFDYTCRVDPSSYLGL